MWGANKEEKSSDLYTSYMNSWYDYVKKSREYECTVSYAYSQFNFEHTKLAIKVVKDMVSILSKGWKIPLPRWLNITPSYM